MGCRMADSDTLGQRMCMLHRGAVMGGMCCCWAVSTKDWLAEMCHLPFSEPLHSTDMPRHWGTPDPQITPPGSTVPPPDPPWVSGQHSLNTKGAGMFCPPCYVSGLEGVSAPPCADCLAAIVTTRLGPPTAAHRPGPKISTPGNLRAQTNLSHSG